VPFIDRSSRVGRSQGASIFWGLVSVFFAAAACYYYWKNHENETKADVMRDQVLQLQEENETLNSQKDHLQASKNEADAQLKTREDLVADKENQLAAEEARLDALSQQTQSIEQQNPSQVAMVKKFNDAIRKLNKDGTADVVERGGRPVLRVPNAELFAPGDATLKPEGKALLNQLTLAISGQIDSFELRVVSYTDTDAEVDPAAKKDSGAKPDAGADAKPHYATSWDLTAARAATLGHYYRDQTTLPFLNVLVIGRGDSEPISSNTGDNHARNRRVEITVTPMPSAFHSPDADKEKDKASSKDKSNSNKPDAATATAKTAPKDSPKPQAEAPAPAKTDKPKDKKTDKGSGH
jgi:flagellar motor protein MotB